MFSKSENGGSRFLFGGIYPENSNSIHWLFSDYINLQFKIYTNDIGFNNETLLDKKYSDYELIGTIIDI